MKRLLSILSIPAAIALLIVIGTISTDEPKIPIAELATELATTLQQETAEPAITEEWISTGYCPCEKCCGKWAFNRPNNTVYGAGGYELVQGLSMASALPYGTVVRITGADEYNGLYICHDRPAQWVVDKYQGKIVDVYFNSHSQAVEFGKRTVIIEIIREGER